LVGKVQVIDVELTTVGLVQVVPPTVTVVVPLVVKLVPVMVKVVLVTLVQVVPDRVSGAWPFSLAVVGERLVTVGSGRTV
jgi:hypothetical protein